MLSPQVATLGRLQTRAAALALPRLLLHIVELQNKSYPAISPTAWENDRVAHYCNQRLLHFSLGFYAFQILLGSAELVFQGC